MERPSPPGIGSWTCFDRGIIKQSLHSSRFCFQTGNFLLKSHAKGTINAALVALNMLLSPDCKAQNFGEPPPKVAKLTSSSICKGFSGTIMVSWSFYADRNLPSLAIEFSTRYHEEIHRDNYMIVKEMHDTLHALPKLLAVYLIVTDNSQPSPRFGSTQCPRKSKQVRKSTQLISSLITTIFAILGSIIAGKLSIIRRPNRR